MEICRLKGERGLAKEKGSMFLRVVEEGDGDIPMHTMNLAITSNLILIY